MKIAAPATSNMPVSFDELDEINLNYSSKNKQEDLIKFCSELKDKRINIFFNGADIEDIFKNNLSMILSLKSVLKDNFYIRLSFNQLYHRKYLEEYDIKYFCEYYIDSYIKLRYFLDNTNVSDIYISDDLCYNLKEIKEICESRDISIRMILNKIPSTFIYAGELYDAPIFRPQDFDILDKYIDTAEFDCWKGNKYLWNKYIVLYRRWFNKKEWNEDLRYLNDDISFEFNNDKVPLGYSSFRSTCMHRCMMRNNSPCSKCNRFLQQMQWFKKDPD